MRGKLLIGVSLSVALLASCGQSKSDEADKMNQKISEIKQQIADDYHVKISKINVVKKGDDAFKGTVDVISNPTDQTQAIDTYDIYAEKNKSRYDIECLIRKFLKPSNILRFCV